MSLNLADLKEPETFDAIRSRIVARLVAAGAPVADWTPSVSGGVENRVVDMVAAGVQQLAAQKVADICTTRFLDLAQGDFLTYMAQRFYGGIVRDPETFTIQNIRISSLKTAPPIKYPAGRFRVRGPSNNYINTEAFEVPSGTTFASGIDVKFRGENSGASYNDVAGTVTKLVTAPAGISVINVAPSDFLEAKLIGTSTGSVSASFAAAPVAYGALRIRIRTSGQVGSATFDWITDQLTAWVNGGPIASSVTVVGAALTFANGSTSPSFIVGDIFTLFVGDAILQRGSDEESDESLRTKCRARWASLSDVPLGMTIVLWAQLASPEVHRVFADADPSKPGGILVTIASESGPASPAAVIAVQDYITARLAGYRGVPGIEESALVQSAHKFPITPAGVVSVPRASLKAVQVAADNAWRKYLGSVGVAGTVLYDRFVQAIMDAGASDADGLAINGGTADLVLGTFQVPVPADGTTLLTTLSWRPT